MNMNTVMPPKAGVSINYVKVVNFNFTILENELSENAVYICTSLNAEYAHQKEDKKIKPVLVIKTIISKVDKTNMDADDKTDIAIFEGRIVGDVSYTTDELDEKVLPNIISILYSYLRPVVAQMSVMAKLPPVDLPILDLRNISIKKID